MTEENYKVLKKEYCKLANQCDWINNQKFWAIRDSQKKYITTKNEGLKK